ncbi:carbon-nitrogen hydrolase family protein [Nemorincola caseinilytica]|uniref:Carbon-nitrogen hydrolase family protein n=2 Tax=Nemorincola caseinilytica TaxID=2054315 RepID=A0ABP8N590_9BACT
MQAICAAAGEGVSLIVFPELSLTGYEPGLANDLATDQNDSRLNVFQQVSNDKNISIGVGLPTRSGADVRISMIIFQPHLPRLTYSKQQLHSDEFPFFVNGPRQVIFSQDTINVAPAICFESLQPSHAENAKRIGADIYLASVAKSASGVVRAYKHYPEIAARLGMVVAMANCVGECDNFVGDGRSAIWDAKGALAAQLDNTSEGLVIYDIANEQATQVTL